MVKTEPKFTVNTTPSGACGNINVGSRDFIICDIWSCKLGLRFGDYLLQLTPTPELLALRLSVLKGEANPGLLADLVEELRENWIEGHYGADLILAKLRECW